MTSVHVPDLAEATPYAFTVVAIYGETAAPASDASLSVQIEPAVTTTTTAPGSTTTTAAPSGSDEVAADTTSATLPVTGLQAGLLVGLGSILVVGGLALVATTRRRRSTTTTT